MLFLKWSYQMNSKIATIIISICEFFLVALYVATGIVYAFSESVDIEHAELIGYLFFVLALCYLIQINFNFFMQNMRVKKISLAILFIVFFAVCMLTTNMKVELVLFNWTVLIANILNVIDFDLLKTK